MTRPLSNYMDRVSFAEVARSRLRLRSRGLELKESRCQHHMNPKNVAELTIDIMTGVSGWKVIDEFQQYLEAPSEDPMWHHELGVRKRDCVSLLVIGAADAYRRLILPSQCLPWRLFTVVNQSPPDALATMRQLKTTYTGCTHCMDPLFAQA